MASILLKAENTPMMFKITISFLVFILFSAGIWGFGIEPSLLKVNRVELTIPKWHTEHQQFKIAILSDIHAGAPFINIEKLQEITEKTNQLKPDIIFILGDFMAHVIGLQRIEPEPMMNALKGLKATYGVVTVLGNHDWYYDGNRIIKAIKAVGFTDLENDVININDNNQSFWVAGISDFWTGKPDIEGTLKKVKDQNPIILITHNPEIFPEIPKRVSLTLAGHTHGGQLKLPLLGNIVLSKVGNRFAAGHIIETGRDLFVSTGIGTTASPFRFGVPPEIVLLTLKEASRKI
jgi:predicted MPP superfamily phosphohydrolase